jgi:hypothetical protein
LELIIINFIISHGTKVSEPLDCSLNEIPVDFLSQIAITWGNFYHVKISRYILQAYFTNYTALCDTSLFSGKS